MTIRRLRTLGRKFMFGSAGLLLSWSTTGYVAAQSSGVESAAAPSAAPMAAPIQRHYFNKNVIQIPVEIKEQSRPLINEIQLFCKDQPGAEWTLRDKVDAASKGFTFQVPKDGEYSFAMVTIDKQGRGYPSDVRNEAPGLIVVIDTQKPNIELTNLGNTPEGQLIKCDVQDAHLDNARTRFFYQGGDRVFRVVDPMPGHPNVFNIPPQAVFTGLVRVTAEDLAGNQAQHEIHVNQVPVAKAEPAKLPAGPEMPPPRPMSNALTIEPGALPRFPGNTPEVKQEVAPINLKPATVSGRPDGSDGPHWRVEHKVDSQPILAQPQETLKRQFVNNTRVYLDYQIENAGQGNVGKVEVWMTRDRAKSWQKVSEDAQRKNHVELQFPGEGIFGVTLVASNSRGVPGTPPAAGDAPDWWIEVDTSKPTAQFTKTELGIENGKSVVHIHWTAQDKNLGDAPVELSYAASPLGPWLSIAKGLKAEGLYTWTPPAEVATKAYLRLIVQDTAGNSAVVNHGEPVVAEGPNRPRVIIRGISTPGQVAPQSAPMPIPPPRALPTPPQSAPMPLPRALPTPPPSAPPQLAPTQPSTFQIVQPPVSR